VFFSKDWSMMDKTNSLNLKSSNASDPKLKPRITVSRFVNETLNT
jgi:hypothetical protein